jgi:PAS domain S-box-containing protein
MGWQHTIYAYPILFATAVSLGLGAYAIRSRREHGHSPVLLIFGTMNVAVAIWTGFSAIKLLSTTPEVKFQLYRLLYVGSELIAPLLLLFALAYTDRTDWLRRRVVVGLFVVPVAFLLLLFTNPYDLVIVETRIVKTDGLVVWRAENGPAYVVLSYVYVLTLALLALGIIAHQAVRLGRSYLPQAALLAIAIVTPMTASFLTSAGVAPFDHDGVNLVPATAAVSSIALGIATFRYQLLDLPPIAYSTVVERSPDGVLVLDSAERIVHANETAYSLLGLSASIVGQPAHAELPALDVTTASSRTVEFSSDSGRTEYLNVRSQPLRQHDDIVGWVLVLRDVTERRRRERELEAFTGAISHDLRAPLRTTEDYLRLLDESLEETADEDCEELIAVARRNNRRMQEMISGLLQYSRIGPSATAFDSVDCDRVVSAVLETLRFEIEEQNATVVVGDLPTVSGVEHLLRRLFQNLLENALTHADSGSPEIRVTASRRDDGWRFRVRDDGSGIEPDELDRVFDLFMQGSGTDPESGTGMGLAICRKIVEQHGGTIDIDSEPGEGTEIAFTIPDGERARTRESW